MRFNRSLLILLVSLSILPCLNVAAYQPKIESLEKMVASSSAVALVKIESAAPYYTLGRKQTNCGVNYTGRVVKSYVGNSQKIVFRSFYPLQVMGEYLIFANPNPKELHAFFLSMGRKRVKEYNDCFDKHELYASEMHGEILEVDVVWESLYGDKVLKVRRKVAKVLGEGKTISFQSEALPSLYLNLLEYVQVPWGVIDRELENFE